MFGKRSLCEPTLIRDLCGELKVSLALLLEVNWLESLTGSIGEPFNRADGTGRFAPGPPLISRAFCGNYEVRR